MADPEDPRRSGRGSSPFLAAGRHDSRSVRWLLRSSLTGVRARSLRCSRAPSARLPWRPASLGEQPIGALAAAVLARACPRADGVAELRLGPRRGRARSLRCSRAPSARLPSRPASLGAQPIGALAAAVLAHARPSARVRAHTRFARAPVLAAAFRSTALAARLVACSGAADAARMRR